MAYTVALSTQSFRGAGFYKVLLGCARTAASALGPVASALG